MAVASTPSPREHELLGAARGGDEEAFRRIVEDHRVELHAHCYRMLGSLYDADDALQETLLRAWRGLPEFRGRSSVRSWLYRIATNVCLDAIAQRPKRFLPIESGTPTPPGVDPGAPLVETVWIEPYPDEGLALAGGGHAAPEARYEQREAVELAFVAALQHLPGNQRAVLILREVLGFSAREVAELLETTVASVNSALQRARRTVDERLPDRSQQATLRSLGDRRIRELAEAYVDAWSRADVAAVRALLAEDVTFSMPPWSSWWRGRDTIARFAQEAACPAWLGFPISANGQLALAYYHLNADTGTYLPGAIDVVTLDGGLIADITAFITPALFARFALPPELACAVRR
jgi:RNA polymerase sigma-70 factor, ECF subfamily